MTRYAKLLGGIGKVRPFDYAYRLAGRRSPDKLPRLIEAHRTALREARKGHRGPVLLAGKSMGGRVGCHLALEEPVDGLICFGYPLKGAGRTAKVRDEVLYALETPVLFVQGTRDPLCPLDLLARVRKKMKARNELWVVESGNHSLETTKTHQKESGETQEAVEAQIQEQVRAFSSSL